MKCKIDNFMHFLVVISDRVITKLEYEIGLMKLPLAGNVEYIF